MVTKDITKLYWKMVWGKIKEGAWKEADMRGHIIGFLGILTLGVILSFLYITGFLSANLFNSLIANVAFEVLTVCIPVGAFTIFLIVSLSKIPAEMYDELGGFLENPFDLEIVPSKSISDTKERWVSISVINNTNNKLLTRCYVKLDSIVDAKTGRMGSRGRKLLWSGMEQNPIQSGDQPLDIAATENGICDIAKAEPQNSVAYYLEWQGQRNKIRPGEYILNLVIFGNWKDISYHPKYHVTLKFDGGNSISLTDIKDGWYEK